MQKQTINDEIITSTGTINEPEQKQTKTDENRTSGELLIESQKRLREIVESACKAEGGKVALANAIAGSRDPADHVLRRHKITSICDGKSTDLSFAELQALDAYLAGKKLSVTSLFAKSSVIDKIGQTRHVTFLIGAKPDKDGRTTYASIWDVRAMSDMLRAIDRRSPGVHFNIEDVELRGKDAFDAAESPLDVFENDKWTDLLIKPESLVCIGSPRACHAAEFMLSQMLDIPPFQPVDQQKPPPFIYVWLNEDKPSSFKLTQPPVGAHTPPGVEAKTPGLYVTATNMYYPTAFASNPRDDYGIVMVQRRPTGQIWIYCGGVTGPATQATIQCLVEKGIELPPRGSKEQFFVKWALVKATIKSDDALTGEDRSISGFRFIYGPITVEHHG